jgi:hypothetical protein
MPSRNGGVTKIDDSRRRYATSRVEECPWLSSAIAACEALTVVTGLPDVDEVGRRSGANKCVTSWSLRPLSQRVTLFLSGDAVVSTAVESPILFDIPEFCASIASADRSPASADEATPIHTKRTTEQNRVE